MVMIFACSATACVASFDGDHSKRGQDDIAADPGAARPSWQPGVSDPSESVTEPRPDPGITADCVFIEWCDNPNSSIEGTVCRVRSSCLNQCFRAPLGPSGLSAALENECTADANFVCGGITPRGVIKNC